MTVERISTDTRYCKGGGWVVEGRWERVSGQGKRKKHLTNKEYNKVICGKRSYVIFSL